MESKEPKEKPKKLEYYLTLFKLEGHETWRATLKGFPDELLNEIKQNPSIVISERRVYKVDRFTGELAEIKVKKAVKKTKAK